MSTSHVYSINQVDCIPTALSIQHHSLRNPTDLTTEQSSKTVEVSKLKTEETPKHKNKLPPTFPRNSTKKEGQFDDSYTKKVDEDEDSKKKNKKPKRNKALNSQRYTSSFRKQETVQIHNASFQHKSISQNSFMKGAKRRRNRGTSSAKRLK